MYVSEIRAPNWREKPLGRWMDRAKEYRTHVRGVSLEREGLNKQRECLKRERWRL